MVRGLLPVSALLLGSAFLLFGGGMNGLILGFHGSVTWPARDRLGHRLCCGMSADAFTGGQGRPYPIL
jgi:hypothetical protein